LIHVEVLDDNGNVIENLDTKIAPGAPIAFLQGRYKASLRPYRSASIQIFQCISSFIHADKIEKASVDEAFLDFTELVDACIKSKTLVDVRGQPIDLSFISDSLDEISRSEFQRSCVDLVNDQFADGKRSSWFILGDTTLDASKFSEVRFAIAAILTAALRHRIFMQLGYTCSAGIASNKLLSKLLSSKHKPNKQTLVLSKDVGSLIASTPLKKIRSFGGKLGKALKQLILREFPALLTHPPLASSVLDDEDGESSRNIDEAFEEDSEGELADPAEAMVPSPPSSGAAPEAIVTAGDAQKLSFQQLRALDDKAAVWIYRAVRGIDFSEMVPRLKVKQIMAAKSFPQSTCSTFGQACKWLRMLVSEVIFRMDEDEGFNHRQAKSLILSWHPAGSRSASWQAMKSKSTPMPPKPRTADSLHALLSARLKKISAEEGFAISTDDSKLVPCSRLAVVARDFVDFSTGSKSIQSYFQARDNDVESAVTTSEICSQPKLIQKKEEGKSSLSRYFKKAKADNGTAQGTEIDVIDLRD
jgi:nucleotidyltransferase/DNA polymerase involved in DNA repair